MHHAFIFSLLLLASFGRADTITVNTGSTLDCRIVQDGKDRVLFIYGEGLMSLPKVLVRDVTRSEEPVRQPSTGTGALRLPAWDAAITKLGDQSWATQLRQIPATVIDTGVFRNVPYKSFKCAGSCELNIYGDPYNPCAVEIGVFRASTRDPAVKRQCVEFMAGILRNVADQSVLRALDLEIDLKERDGLKFEVTPPTAEDAYGGWWVSVYDPKLVETARASEPELAEISVSPGLTKATPPVRGPASSGADVDDKPPGGDKSEPTLSPQSATESIEERLPRWTREDLREARTSPSSANPAASTGRVYVRGYLRKDGTYVRPHSRRR